MKSKTFPLVLLCLVMAAGGWMRFSNLDWGRPYRFHFDENHVVLMSEECRESMLQAYSHYGPLPSYLTAICYDIRKFFNPQLDHWFELTLSARIVSAIFGTLTIILVYVLGEKVSGSAGGLIAAAIFACTPLHIQSSHYGTSDCTMLFFVVLSGIFAVTYFQSGREKMLVASLVTAAFAVSAKFTGCFAVFLGLSAHAARYQGGFSLKKILRHFFSGPVPWGIGGMIGVLMILVPTMFINPWRYFVEGNLLFNLACVKGKILPDFVLQYHHSTFLDYFTGALAWGVSPWFTAFFVIAFFHCLFIWRKTAAVPLVVFTSLFFVSISTNYAKYARYMLPVVPFLAVITAESFTLLMKRMGKFFRLLLAVIMTLAVTAQAAWALAFTGVYEYDTRLKAAEWMNRNIPQGAPVIMESDHGFNPPVYASTLNPGGKNYFQIIEIDPVRRVKCSEFGQKYSLWAYMDKNPWTRTRRRYGPRPPLYTAEDMKKEISSALERAQWIVLSERFRESAGAVPEHFPVLNAFYKNLFSEKLGFKLKKVFRNQPSFGRFTIDDKNSPHSMRIYDHPTIWVFKKESIASSDPGLSKP